MVNLSTLTKAIEAFRLLNPLIPAQTIEAFLEVAQKQRATRQDIAYALKLETSSAYRAMAMLGTAPYRLNGKVKPGMGLVAKRQDPNETRRNEYYLTTKGERMKDQLKTILEG